MTQVCLVDSTRLSSLLREAIAWQPSVSSIFVSARNGSILAYAFKHATPSVKAMRTRSTTMTTAYTVASQDVLVFEAQRTGALTVISPVADHVLLAVTGPEPEGTDPYEKSVHEAADPEELDGNEDDELNSVSGEDGTANIRNDLELVNQELANILREELAGMKWPEDI